MKIKISTTINFIAFSLIILFSSCSENGSKKMENEILKISEIKEYPDTLIKAKYDDGRISEVRIIYIYNPDKDTTQANKGDEIKLLGFVMEWNKYEAVVCNSQVAITQLECNTMMGGTTDVSSRISKSASLYFKVAEKALAEKFSSLTLIDKIPKIGRAHV